jgi:hypothetical protein
MSIRSVVAVLAGGVIAFVWSCVSWMVIPWHQPTMSIFENEEAVGRAIQAASPQPGIYTYPGWTDDEADMTKKHNEGPYVFASVVPNGVGSEMAGMMVGGFIANLVGAALLLSLLPRGPHVTWRERLRVVFVAALFVSLVPALMNWNWWHFPVPFTLVAVVDGIVGWTLAGGVVAVIAGKN